MTTICKKRGAPRQSLANRIGRRRLRESGELYLIMLPVLVMIFIFFYMPMFGVVIAFQDYVPGDPFFAFDGSTKWVGLQHFKTFFSSIYFPRLLKNTLTLSLMNLAFGFWVPIAFALLLNEVTHLRYKKLVQTASYMPYFISMVVAAGMVVSFIEKDGLVNQIITLLGGDPVSFRTDPKWFPVVYTVTNIWKSFGWNSILYLSAMASIDPALYESARLDGANRWQQITRITVPLLKPTIITLCTMQIGRIFYSDFGLFYQVPMDSGALYAVTQTIDTYVYRSLLQLNNIAMASAASAYQSVVCFIVVLAANGIVRKVDNENAMF